MSGSWVGPHSRFQEAGDESAGLGAWRDVQVAARHGPVTLDRWVMNGK
jgi:hypothetical protein